MADWNAAQYLVFERERTRAARDLLGAVPLQEARVIVDLGCGPGNSTALLVKRFPQAAVTGVDTSPDMLAKARIACPHASFIEGDVVTFRPRAATDLVFANAVLQWVPDHGALLPRLMDLLAPGGALAVQMPDNLEEPSHVHMREVAAAVPFAQELVEAAASRTVLASFDTYYDWLRPHAAAVDLWRTTYVHPLDGPQAIVEWLKATGLRPFLDPLDADEQTHFIAAYTRALEQAYPRRPDGKSLLRFPRFFLIAIKP